jgi:choline dehydrogenase
LQLSGVGPGPLLRERGIDVRHELPGVGENLHDHWYVRMTHRVHNTVTLSGKVGTRLGRMMQGARYFATKSGPLAAPPMMVIAHAKSDPAVAADDIELLVSVASFSRIGAPMDPYPGMSASVTVNRPTSRGYVRIRSGDPSAHPAILPACDWFAGSPRRRRWQGSRRKKRCRPRRLYPTRN